MGIYLIQQLQLMIGVTSPHRALDLVSVTRLCNLLNIGQVLKPLATINFPKSLTFLGNFGEGVKIYHFPSEINFGQLL